MQGKWKVGFLHIWKWLYFILTLNGLIGIRILGWNSLVPQNFESISLWFFKSCVAIDTPAAIPNSCICVCECFSPWKLSDFLIPQVLKNALWGVLKHLFIYFYCARQTCCSFSSVLWNGFLWCSYNFLPTGLSAFSFWNTYQWDI